LTYDTEFFDGTPEKKTNLADSPVKNSQFASVVPDCNPYSNPAIFKSNLNSQSKREASVTSSLQSLTPSEANLCKGTVSN